MDNHNVLRAASARSSSDQTSAFMATFWIISTSSPRGGSVAKGHRVWCRQSIFFLLPLSSLEIHAWHLKFQGNPLRDILVLVLILLICNFYHWSFCKFSICFQFHSLFDSFFFFIFFLSIFVNFQLFFSFIIWLKFLIFFNLVLIKILVHLWNLFLFSI